MSSWDWLWEVPRGAWRERCLAQLPITSRPGFPVMQRYRDAEMQRCGDAEMWRCGDAPWLRYLDGVGALTRLVNRCFE